MPEANGAATELVRVTPKTHTDLEQIRDKSETLGDVVARLVREHREAAP